MNKLYKDCSINTDNIFCIRVYRPAGGYMQYHLITILNGPENVVGFWPHQPHLCKGIKVTFLRT